IDEFSQQILIPNIRLVSNAVYVVWKWKMKSQVQINTLEPTDEEENYNEEDNEEEKEISVSDSAEDESYETVTFKCIGATREISFQTALRTASSRIRNQDYVPVRLTPEPNNIYDSKAIAFECQLGGKWEKIGYVIKELLDIVHDAIESKEIVKVEFSWIKYITDWRRSGPGHFAGISISKNSRWDKTILKYSSTR
uniref:HIRAN domain-containing protein n=1 Tax=Amphimedon queenslandica TaxID=400682 RepID=A0A1X7TRH2_AMPQE